MARTKYERGYWGATLGDNFKTYDLSEWWTRWEPMGDALEIKKMLNSLHQEIINQARIPSDAFTEPMGSSRVVATTIDIAASVPKARRLEAGEGDGDGID